jgi:hypothetical protein
MGTGMYVTAQRVRRVTAMPSEGINVIVAHHNSAMIARDARGWIDLDLAARQPTTKIATDCPVAPGGNLVLSFLDVALDDVAARDHTLVVAALQNFEAQLLTADTSPRPVHMVIGRDVAVRFTNHHRGAHTDIDEFNALRERLLLIVHQGAVTSSSHHDSPLTILVTRMNGEIQMRLDDDAKQRIERVHHGRFAASGFFIEETKWHDLLTQGERDELINLIVMGMTGLAPEEIAVLGGVRFVEQEREALRWPQP